MNEKQCNNRREFLVKSTATAGGLILSLAGIKAVNAEIPGDDLTIKIDDKSPLNNVGGSKTFESGIGNIIVVRTSETAFKAYSAVCTHKGGDLTYNESSKMLVCGLHNSKFDADGKNAGGPAKNPIKVYTSETTLVVKLK